VFTPGAEQRLANFFRFFHDPNLKTVSLSAATHTRAAAIRGAYLDQSETGTAQKRYGLADSLHVAAAIEAGCTRSLTNDAQLSNFKDIVVDELL
jgi:predicted nucleic acid-binding protein